MALDITRKDFYSNITLLYVMNEKVRTAFLILLAGVTGAFCSEMVANMKGQTMGYKFAYAILTLSVILIMILIVLWVFDRTFFTRRSRSPPVVDPQNRGKFHGWIKDWSASKRRNLYSWQDTRRHTVEGRKVKAWLWVYGADDSASDMFAPIFYRKKGRKKTRRRKK